MTGPMSDDVRIQILAEKSAAATAALRQTKEELLAIRQEANQGQATYARMSLAIAKATVEFEAGDIQAEEYRRRLQVLRQEATRLGITQQQLGRVSQALNTNMALSARTTSIMSGAFGMAGAPILATAAASSRLAATTRVAGQGIGTVRSSLASLSMMAIGTSGTLGTLAGALFQFAVGNALAVGAVAGIAAIAVGYRMLSKSAREAKEEAKKLHDELERWAAAQRPEIELRREQLAGVTGRISELEAQQGRITPTAGPGLAPGAAALQVAARRRQIEQQLNVLYRDRENLERKITELEGRGAADAEKRRSEEIAALVRAHDLGNLTLEGRRRALQLERDINAELRNANLELSERNRLTEESRRLAELVRIEVAPLAVAIPRATDQRFPATGVPGAQANLDLRRRMGALTAGMERLIEPVAPGLASTAQGAKELAHALQQVEIYLTPVISKEELYAQKLSLLRMVMDEMELTVEQRTEAERRLKQAMDQSKISTQQWAAAAILATGQLAAMAIRGGGAGSFIGGLLGLAGGIVTPFNPLIGAGLMATGTVITAASQRGEPTRVSIANYEPTALQQQKQVIMPSRFTFQFYGPRGELTQEEILYTTRYLEDIDAVVRIPGTRLGAP